MTMSDPNAPNGDLSAFDRDAYLARIGYDGSLEPSVETLRALHFAHASAIPFENLDVMLGRTISLDLDHLQAKLVTARRGGYCFEQNALFAAALESLGFEVVRLAARVRMGATVIRPRTHMLLEVRSGREPWLADVGFGASGPLYPIRLREREEAGQGAWTFRVRFENPEFVLESKESDGWLDLYAFTREPQHPVDYETGNHYTSTYPHSPFVQNLIVQKGGLESRLILRNRELTEWTQHEKNTSQVEDEEAVIALLAGRFGLHFPPETRFPIRT
jgi:N-hydroxyarylamine O-acetyltransferase